MEHQNWATTYVNKKAGQHNNHNHNHTGGNRKRSSYEEEDDGNFHAEVTYSPYNLRMAIMKARQAKKWKQKDLAQHANVTAHLIKTYEDGTAIPNNAFIAKLERVLGSKLPRVPKKHN